MANSNNSIITGKLKGMLGKQLVFREWAGKTVVAKAPKSRTGDLTNLQIQVQKKFLIASRYAKSIVRNADQSIAQAYATALRPRQNVYSRALEDFMSSPVVERVDTRSYKGAIGNKIVVRAIDDFRVTEVRVEIYDKDNQLIETGDAVVNINGIDWTYTTTQANNPVDRSKIKAIAVDVPGNEGVLEVEL